MQMLAMPFSFLLKVFGVEAHHFKVLLAAKLKMDFRRPPNSFQSASKKQTLLKQLLVYLFLGAIVLYGIYRLPDLMLQLTLFYAFLIVFAGTTMLTEFTSVLFDEKENYVLLPRPISSRTLLAVRLVHIAIYISNIALSLSLPFSIYLAVNYGFLVLSFLVGVFLCAWFTLLLAVGFYMLLSRLVTLSRFKDVLNYFQIGLAVIIMASYQLVPNFIEGLNMEQYTFTSTWWTHLLPSVWFAGFACFTAGIPLAGSSVWFLITVAVTVIGTLLLVRALSTGFNSIIAETGSGTTTTSNKVGKVTHSGRWLNSIIKVLCVSEVEKMGWAVTMSHIRRDRKLKQQLYPMLAYSVIMAIVFLKPQLNNFIEYLADLRQSSTYLMLFLAGFFGALGIFIIPYTDSPEAGWIYDVATTDKKYHIQTGAIKAVLFTFFLPLYLLYSVPVILIWGFGVLPYFVLGVGWSAALAIVSTRIQRSPLPFSKAREMINKGELTLIIFLGMLMVGVIVGAVYLLSLIHVAFAIGLCATLPILISLSHRWVRGQK